MVLSCYTRVTPLLQDPQCRPRAYVYPMANDHACKAAHVPAPITSFSHYVRKPRYGSSNSLPPAFRCSARVMATVRERPAAVIKGAPMTPLAAKMKG